MGENIVVIFGGFKLIPLNKKAESLLQWNGNERCVYLKSKLDLYILM